MVSARSTCMLFCNTTINTYDKDTKILLKTDWPVLNCHINIFKACCTIFYTRIHSNTWWLVLAHWQWSIRQPSMIHMQKRRGHKERFCSTIHFSDCGAIVVLYTPSLRIYRFRMSSVHWRTRAVINNSPNTGFKCFQYTSKLIKSSDKQQILLLKTQ